MRNIGHYAAHLKSQMPKEAFEPKPARLGFAFFYLALASAIVVAFSTLELSLVQKFGLSLLLGWSFGCFGFIGHELLHGSMVKNTKVQSFIGFFLLAPFLISPTFWRYWHNRLHHSKTQRLIQDPDAFPTLRVFGHSKFLKFMFPFTPGSGHKRSILYFFFWFSFNALVAQVYFRFRNDQFEHLDHKRVSLEFAGQVALAALVLYFVGFANLLWVFAIPFAVQNYYVMHYIATNHNISPLTKINDPLANSLTVTNPPLLEWLHFYFGYHVEHHISPTMTGKNLKLAHEILKRDFADIYQFMPVTDAMKTLYRTPRIYKDSYTLVHPETGAKIQIQSLLRARIPKEAPSAPAAPTFAEESPALEL